MTPEQFTAWGNALAVVIAAVGGALVIVVAKLYGVVMANKATADIHSAQIKTLTEQTFANALATPTTTPPPGGTPAVPPTPPG